MQHVATALCVAYPAHSCHLPETLCSIPCFVNLEMYVTFPNFMQHVGSKRQQPCVLRLQKRGVVDFTRRRRWLRRRRQDLTRPSPPPQEAPAPSPRQSPAARRTSSIRQDSMLPASLMLLFCYCLGVQGTACHHVGSVSVKHLCKCIAAESLP